MEGDPQLSEKEHSKPTMFGESKIEAKNRLEEPFHQAKEENPVTKAQKQISSQRTVGVFSPEE